ncbi:MAG TPA: ABC transporter substrate-binding protein [Pseudolabrys sp.]|nr:ABC transporter substrate-binding protein [Pseudolabrys sp.]
MRLWKAVCAAGALLAATVVVAAAQADTSIRFSLDSRIDGTAAPFFLAIDRGYFRHEKLNVTVEPAATRREPLTRVASGDYALGFVDINALIKFRDANPDMPVKAVFIVYNRPPYAVVGRKSRGIAVPKDLEGRRLGAPTDDITYAQWPLFAKAAAIDSTRVKVENIGAPVRVPMLAAGQVDALTGFSFTTALDLKDRGVPANDITVMDMADYGLALYGNAIIVNTQFAAGEPDAVRGFLRAFLRGLKDTVKSPGNAIDSVIRRADGAQRPLELERLTMMVRDNIITPEVRAQGFGGFDAGRFEKALEQLTSIHKFKMPPKTDAIFDQSFLPSARERRFQ